MIKFFVDYVKQGIKTLNRNLVVNSILQIQLDGLLMPS